MIRIRHPDGSATATVQPSMTLDELRALVQSKTSIAPEEQQLKSGFPPKIIPELPGSTPISDAQINLQKGDQLTVERRTRTVHAPAPTKSAPSAPPAPSAPKEQAPGTGKVEDGSVYKLVDGAYLSLKVVPDDNSCLFNSVGCVLMRRSDAATCRELREIVASAIRNNPFDYSEPVLGKSPEEYIRKILHPDTWGGAIELRIFSEHFKVEINSVDIASGRVDRYGEELNYPQKIFVAYSGIHYDALLMLPVLDAPLEFATTTFEADQAERILPAVLELAADLKKRKYYTDTATFTLRCKQCNSRLVGEKGIAQHSMQTGHSDFEEYTT